MKKPNPIEGFQLPEEPFTAGEISHYVYVSANEGPDVILIHELPGLTRDHVKLGHDLAAKGFRVHMPLLYGRPNGSNRNLRNIAITVRLCLAKEFKALERNFDRPFTSWLSALIDSIAVGDPEKKVGVIGMCLTGGFAIATLANPHVGAGISCQPALPFRAPSDPGMSSESLKKAVAAAEAKGGCPLLCLRFEDDKISPKAKTDAYEAAFAEGTMRRRDYPGKKHSTLTYDRVESAFDEAVDHLKANFGL